MHVNSRSHLNHRTATAVAVFVSLLTLALSPVAEAVTPRSFSAGSLIIPMDNCWQDDIAQPTPPKDTNPMCAQLNGGGNPLTYTPTANAASNSMFANGARRAYGLMWHLLQAGVPLYQVINSTKSNIDDPDLTIDASGCTGVSDAVVLVDQSLPASFCGLDPLHPKDVPTSLQGVVSPLCTNVSPGTFAMGASHVPTISYRGGPFVVDATDAALARDVMAWYFAAPVTSGAGPYHNPNLWLDANGALGTTNQFVDPGHHPLHWSQYAPSAFVTLYPSVAFGFDVGGHTIFSPCNDPTGLCSFTTWDPIATDGHVDPYLALVDGAPAENAITYATVNVHQAQTDFTANVGQLVNNPIPTIALAGITDPIHLNTFRFYLEEAGLEFGPCASLPNGVNGWTAPSGGSFPSGGTEPIIGSGDLFFDVSRYPFPNNLVAATPPYSAISAQCAEGIASDDATFNAFDEPWPYSGSPPLTPSQGGGPYGKVVDIIAPEITAFENLLELTPQGPGCGAARYAQLWIPHWDATIQSGPVTDMDPLSGTQQVATAGCPAALAAYQTPILGKCPYDPQIVQTIMSDLPIYVAHGGNLLAECIGAASLEDDLMHRILLSNPNGSVDNSPSHFMTEGQGGLTAFLPVASYNVLNPAQATLTQATPVAAAAVSQCMVGSAFNPVRTSFTPVAAPLASPPAPRNSYLGHPGPLYTVPVSGGPGANFQAAAFQVNQMLGVDAGVPNGDTYRLVEYAPVLSNGTTNQASLSDPFLQLGDFYFLGISGLTESFSETANNGYSAGARLPNTLGYAYAAGHLDTQVLIRGVPSANGVTPDTNFQADSLTGSGNGLVTQTLYGDYWIKNRNSTTPGAGEVVYLQGDSFDGQPDGLRMVWSSILNLSFVPSDIELARSSPAGYTDGGDSFLLQGTFEQSNINYGHYTPIFTGANDAPNWIFPPERGHLRQIDLNLDNCFLAGGGVDTTNPACQSAVVGAGSNTTSFQGLTNTGPTFWDSSEYLLTGAPPATLPIDSLLTGTQFSPPPIGSNLIPSSIPGGRRVIFTHLYSPLAGANVGLKPVWVDPFSTDVENGNLTCTLFPESRSCGAGNIGFPLGSSGPAIPGPLQCSSCQAATDAGVVGNIAVSDVEAMLTVVEHANGGCTPLLQDSCFTANSPQVHCLDACWSQCLVSCVPPPAGGVTLPQNFPPFSAGCQACAYNCAGSCNSLDAGPPAACGSGNCCGVTSGTPDIASFRETCFPAIGGIDHSTPVIVNASPTSLNEFLPDPTNSAPVSAQCRPTVAYVGAGDGMLHAIYLQDPPSHDAFGNACPALSGCGYHPGEEIWAFVPNQELPLIHTGGNCVRSLFVDGVPVVKDVYANFSTDPTSAPTYHTVLTETLGQGGNHVFALDVTDPLAPVRGGTSPLAGTCNLPGVSSLSLATVPVVLWEQGDPLDPTDPKPYIDRTTGNYAWQGPSGADPFQDTTAEGPGFTPALALSIPASYHHYLGQSSTVFVGSLAGSGPAASVTYVAGQNSPISGYGTQVALSPCGGACNPKDFSLGGGVGDIAIAHGPTGEVVYAFDSATGIAKTVQTAAGTSVLEHFATLYSRAASRSNGFNDIPAPVLGVSTTGRPGDRHHPGPGPRRPDLGAPAGHPDLGRELRHTGRAFSDVRHPALRGSSGTGIQVQCRDGHHRLSGLARPGGLRQPGLGAAPRYLHGFGRERRR